MKNKLALVLAIALGLVAVYGFQRVLQKRQEAIQGQARLVRIVAAGQHIVAGTTITPQMLYVDDDGSEGKIVPENAVTTDNFLVGDTRMVGQTINRTVERGDPLMWSYFRQPVEKLEQRLGSSERALTLRVDAISGVAGNLVPGSRVDIIGTFPVSVQAGGARAPAAAAPAASTGTTATHTLLLLDNVKILAVDNRTRDEEYVISAGARVRTYSTITVAVSPLEANLLVYAQQAGALTMALRSPVADTKAAAAQEISDKNLLDLAAAARKEREDRAKSAGALDNVVP